MKTFLAAAAIVALSSASAFAAEETMKSTTDAPAASGQDISKDSKMAPGTTGAMQNSTGGVATTPDEVKKQGGMGTAPTSTDGKAAPAGDKK